MQPLLLINGYAATGSDWDPGFLAGLERGFELVHPDNRGTGGVPLGSGELTVERLAADMVELLDARGLDRVAVAGWSMGGFVAQQVAAVAADRVSALVLLATDPGGPDAVRADPQVTARLFDHGGTPREQATRLIGLLFPPGVAERIDAEAGDLVADTRAALPVETLFAEEAAMGSWYERPCAERLAAIAAPTLVLAGESDVVIPPANAALLAAAIANARLETFAGAGHAFIAQEPERVSASIKKFASTPPTGR